MKHVAGRESKVATDRATHGSDTEVEWLIAKTEQGISVTGSEKCIVKKEAPACDTGMKQVTGQMLAAFGPESSFLSAERKALAALLTEGALSPNNRE